MSVIGTSLRVGLPLAALLAFPDASIGQPAPSFHASCGDLRAQMKKLGPITDDVVTVIAVRGTLTIAEYDGTLAYMSVCKKPDPQVLCVTYGLSGRTIGNDVVLTGTLARVGPDHIMLDPCLNSAPNRE